MLDCNSAELCLCGDPECRSCFPDYEAEREAYKDRLADEIDRVLDEIDEGQHDSDLISSPLVDQATAMKVARQRAQNLHVKISRACDVSAINDLKLQIREYAKDLAERRLL